MSFLVRLKEDGQQARSTLKKTSTIVTDVCGRRFNEPKNPDGTKLEVTASTGSCGYVVDSSPDPGICECHPGIFIGSQDAAHNYDGVFVQKKKSKKSMNTKSSDEEENRRDDEHEYYPGLAKVGITHVLNLFSQDRPFEDRGIIYQNTLLLDIPEQALTSSHLEPCLEFVHSAMSKPSGKVLVHCNAGISRSSTIIIAYLIKYEGMSYQQALQVVRKNRPFAQPNIGFEAQLKALETLQHS